MDFYDFTDWAIASVIWSVAIGILSLSFMGVVFVLDYVGVI